MPDAQYWEALHERHRGGFAAVGYTALGEGFNRESYRRLRLPALRRLLRRYGFQPSSVLEAGVGTGAYAALWEEAGIREWVGIDVSVVAVADLKARFPAAEFHVVDLGAPSGALPGRNFDLMTAIDVLYHIVCDDAFGRALTWLAGHVSGGCPRGLRRIYRLAVGSAFCTCEAAAHGGLRAHLAAARAPALGS